MKLTLARLRDTLLIALLATAIINLSPAGERANCASAATLPSGLGWGMTAEECRSRMQAAGYEIAVPDIPEASADRALRSFALVNGIRDLGFYRRTSAAAERVALRLLDDALFLVSVGYDDFGRGFRERAVEEISGHMGSNPRRLPTPNSDMDVFAWSAGVTSAQFGYRELPKLGLYFAQVEYRNIPVMSELKRLGLQ